MKTFTIEQIQGEAAAVLDVCDRDGCVSVTRAGGKSYIMRREVALARQQHTPPPDSTKLSSKKTIGHWKAIRDKLAGAPPEVWKDVLRDFYYDRLKTRYLDPIDAIKATRFFKGEGIFKGEGFAIVAIQCSLIEFLESCFQGINYTHKKPPSAREYISSGEVFVSFLTRREPFKRQFNEALAHDFYGSVRCGVLHEARTKGTWIIKAKSESSLIIDPKGPILYRDNFQEAIIEFIENYRCDVPQDVGLQDAFIHKFNHLCT